MRLAAMRLLAAFFELADVLGLRQPGNCETRDIIAGDDLACMWPYEWVQGWICTLVGRTLSLMC
jgi:hypothetical protein